MTGKTSIADFLPIGRSQRLIVVLALPGVVLGDFAIPVELFSRVRRADGQAPYKVVTCGVTRTVKSTSCAIQVNRGLSALDSTDVDTVIVAGIEDIQIPVPIRITEALRRVAARGCRVMSICSGAFVLAETGLLEGRRATTHWNLASELARRHPRIKVESDVLYVDNGRLLTSAGAMAGADLCLYVIRKDYGAAVAAESARFAVAALERDGGQAQFIRQVPPVARGSLQPVQEWAARNLGGSLDVSLLARRHGTSSRTFHRHFVAQTGLTPAQWLLRRRIARAQELLETTALSIERVAHAVGFSAASTFRQRFSSIIGTSPLYYRRLYRPRLSPRRVPRQHC